MKDETLKDVDDSLVQVGEFLHELITHKKHIECLQQFIGCKKIVEWLQEETNGQLMTIISMLITSLISS